MQERRHGLRVSRFTYGTMIPGDSDLTFRTATGELVKSGKRMQIVGCDDWGFNLRIRGVQALLCKPLLSVGEYTTKGGVTAMYVDEGYMLHKCSNVAKKIDAWVHQEFRDSRFSIPRLYSCVQRKQRVQHQSETKRKRD